MIPSIKLPECKSIIIRQMIISFLTEGVVREVLADDCSDVRVTAQALSAILSAQGTEETIIDVRDCGAAYRFLLPILSATPGSWLLTGTPRLLQRPIKPLVDVLQAAGADIRVQADGLHIRGHVMRAETISIDCRHSSQYASALLLSAPLTGLQRLYTEPAAMTSSSYVELTRQCMPYWVEMPGRPFERKAIGLAGDWSAALFWYAYALLHQQAFTLQNLSLDSLQSDAVIAQWFEALGICSRQVGSDILITPNGQRHTSPITLDVRNNLDTVPVMCMLATLMPLDILFLHTHNLRYKESDRGRQLSEQLSSWTDITLTDDQLHVHGRDHCANCLTGAPLKTHHDHRLAMAFLLAARPEDLDDTDCLTKSYPMLVPQLRHVEKHPSEY